MKILFFVLLVSFNTCFLFAQNTTCTTINKTQELLASKHINSFHFSKSIGHEILALYFSAIYQEQLVFSRKDSVQLHQKIEGKESLCEIFETTKPFILSKLQRHDSLLKRLKFSNVVVSKKESYSLFFRREEDVISLQKLAKKYYKYSYFKNSYLIKQTTKDFDKEQVFNKIILKESSNLQKIINNENELLNLFLNAICLRADPHSAFFESNEKEQWLTALAREELSFGLELVFTENSLLKISHIVPGGSAWNSKEFDEGDVITQLELENGENYLVDMNTDVLSDVLQTNNSIIFHVTKQEGNKATIKLTKTKIEVSENVINGYLFKVKTDNIGYINLSSFYTANPMLGNNGSASDLAREILRLKKDNISGLILDLRGNGGGYMHEALGIAGLFINEGVLALQKTKGDRKPRYLKDPNRGVVYDGKLIVLVNQFSASASELLAGTLQQYNRAIIVGSTTYGKGTMQQVYPLDSIAEIRQENNFYVKVTMGKFYMIDKKTHQVKGIVPDIVLPSLYDGIQLQQEQTELYHLESDEITRQAYVTLLPVIPFEKLKSASSERIKLANWKKNMSLLRDSLVYFSIPSKEIFLTEEEVFEWENAKQTFFEKLDNDIISEFTAYEVSNTSIYKELLQEHAMHNIPNKLTIERLKKDLRLFESLNILSDYIHQN